MTPIPHPHPDGVTGLLRKQAAPGRVAYLDRRNRRKRRQLLGRWKRVEVYAHYLAAKGPPTIRWHALTRRPHLSGFQEPKDGVELTQHALQRRATKWRQLKP